MYDMREGAAREGKAKLGIGLEKLVAKGKLRAEDVAQIMSRILPIQALEDAATARLVIEAIVEKLDAKQALFRQLETIVNFDCVLATNTSSISVTAIANGLQYSQRLVGMHFFNPVPLMKLVEVVSGLQTSSAVANAIFELSKDWGKVPVHARSTPGFIVNRIARPYYAETLALLQEQAAVPAVLDACLRGAGFRMGPCELMDLIGHDTNLSVTSAMYEANFYDKRFAPSLVQRELVDGGFFGRKSGRGFYEYSEATVETESVELLPIQMPGAQTLCVHGTGPVAERLKSALSRAGRVYVCDENSDWIGLAIDNAQLRLTDGRPASQLGMDVAVFDWPLTHDVGTTLAWSVSSRSAENWPAEAEAWLQALSFKPQRIADVPGLVVARTVAMLINEAADAVQQGVCTSQGVDEAMKLGMNYPAGPFELLTQFKVSTVIGCLGALDSYYCGERYRVSLWLRHRSWKEDNP